MNSPSSSRSCFARARTINLLAASLAVAFLWSSAHRAQATPLSFTLFNVNSSNQSRLDLVASAKLAGGELTSSAQSPAGGLNGQGSLSTLYNDTASNDSTLLTNVTQHTIAFPGGSTAVASNTRGLFSDLQLRPNVGGTSGTAPGSYGVKFTSPQNIVIPPLDIPDVGMINLGTLQAIDVNIALRNVVVDITSGSLALTPGATYPQTFDSSQLTIGISGTSDILISAFLKQASFGDFVATGAALLALDAALTGQGIDLIFSANLLQLGYNVGFGFSTPLPLTTSLNDDANPATLEHIGPNLRLTVPVKFDIVPETLPDPLDELLTAQLGLSGKLIGQTPFVIVDVPEPSTVVLAAMAAATLGMVAMRGKRRKRQR